MISIRGRKASAMRYVLQIVIVFSLSVSRSTGQCPTVGDLSWMSSQCQGFACHQLLQVSQVVSRPLCCVTDMSEAALRQCVGQPYSHVVFPSSPGEITLPPGAAPLTLSKGVIVDGGQGGVRISGGGGLVMRETTLLRRVTLHNITGQHYGVMLTGRYAYAWIHECALTGVHGKSIYIGDGYSHVTISYTRFDPPASSTNTMYMQIYTSPQGSFSKDSATKVTLHHNYLHAFRSSAPWIKYGYLHMFNNVIDEWSDFGVACTNRARCLIQNNWFNSSLSHSRNIIELDRNSGVAGNIKCASNVLVQWPAGREPQVSPLQVEQPPYTFTMQSAANNSQGESYKQQLLSSLPQPPPLQGGTTPQTPPGQGTTGPPQQAAAIAGHDTTAGRMFSVILTNLWLGVMFIIHATCAR